GETEMELGEGAPRVRAGQALDGAKALVRPAREGEPDLGLKRVVVREDPARLRTVAAVVEARAAAKRPCLAVDADAEIDRARQRLDGGAPLLVDVRERDEWDEGHIPGAIHIPRGSLESRIEQAVRDRGRELIVYCASGSRSAFAAKTLQELGYEQVSSLTGGFTDWKRNGFPTVLPRPLAPAPRTRHRRHPLIPDVGEEARLR